VQDHPPQEGGSGDLCELEAQTTPGMKVNLLFAGKETGSAGERRQAGVRLLRGSQEEKWHA